MWTMDSSDRSDLTVSDSFHGRKLRPLVPRLNPSVLPKMTVNSSMAVTPCFSHLHPGNDHFSLNHRLGGVSDHQSKNTDFMNSTQPPFGSSRWNPTPEQLQALEELYRRGTRTPTAEQIQQIAAQLRLFGKIEGKNVFYWFQNHKARERQKRRRELESHPADHHQQQQDGDDNNNNNNGKNLLERKESVMRRTSTEVEQTKNWVVPSSNCSTTLSEESVSIHRAGVAESGTDGWMQLEERELQQTRSTVERQASTWQLMGLTSSPPYQLIDSITTAAAAAAAAEALNTINPKERPLILRSPPSLEHETRESQGQTLQLFPVQGDHISCGCASNRNDDNNNNNGVVVHSAEGDNELAAVVAAAAAATDAADLFTPNQFFEFL